MTKAVIFDFFGVLVGRGYWYVYSLLGGDRTKDKQFVEDLLGEANLGLIDEEEFAKRAIARLGIDPVKYREAYQQDALINYPLLDFIKNELKPHYKVSVLSNASTGVIQQKVPAAMLDAIFDDVIVSADVRLVKPDPAIFTLAAERLGVDPKATIFVDDRADYLEGAKAIGMKTIHYQDRESFKQKFAELN